MVNKKQYQEKYQVLEAHVCYRGLFAPKLTKDLKKKKKVSEPTTSFSKQKYQLIDLYKCFKQPQDYAYDQITVIKIIKKKKKG